MATTTTVHEGRPCARAALTLAVNDAEGLSPLWGLDAWEMALAATELKIPHQLLGPLDLPQWTRFAGVHTRHHLAIADEVVGAP